jgi:hypothetical protein
MNRVNAYGTWNTNAELIADIAKLRYLDGRVLDPTWGLGNFWTIFKPRKLVAHDLFTLDGIGIYDLHRYHRKQSFDTVIVDPPYRLNGKPDPAFDGRYGTQKRTSVAKRMELVYDCAIAAATYSRQYAIVKVMDQVVSGNVRWQTREVTNVVEDEGFRLIDRFDMLGGRPQPSKRTRKCAVCRGTGVGDVLDRVDCDVCNGTGRVPSNQQHANRNASTALVFERGKVHWNRGGRGRS